MAKVIPSWINRARRGTTGKKQGFKHGFRSGLEVGIGEVIEAQGQTVRYEERKLTYLVPASRHLYTYDFELDNGIILEGKGIFDSTDRAKHLFVKAQYGDADHGGLDIRFVFTNPNAKTGPGAKGTLAEWCERYGFKYAKKVPPVSWFHEPGPKLKPEEVIKRGPFAWLKEYPQGYQLP